MGDVIGIVSLKGGVGKTSTVVSLGAAIATFGKKVLLIDGNLSAPNLGLHLNIIDPEITLHHVLSRKAKIKDSIQKMGEFDLIPASIVFNRKVNPLNLKDKIKHLKQSYDYIIIDSSPSLKEETLGVMLASDAILVVTTPDHPTLSTTISAITHAKKRGTKINGLVLNRVHNKNFELSLKDVEKTSGVPVMAVIPHDVNILKALSKFKPFIKYKPKSAGAEEYLRLAAALTGEKYKPVKVKRLMKWLNPKKQDINRTIFYEEVFS
jgi:MinD-like ATPase involved in chromosome partitioning or flagellar assembly